jgi:hypothetical protein
MWNGARRSIVNPQICTLNPDPMKTFLSILLLGLTGFIGCQSVQSDISKPTSRWDFPKTIGWGEKKPEPPQVPVRVVSTWKDTVLHRTGKKPMRGFGGRLIFFGQDKEEPVRVDGQLVVYAFDETCRPQHDSSPTKKYIFPAEQFVRHESESKLGPSYSVWLPWDAVGGKQKNISLIVRFEPRGGSYVLGEQTRHLLPGLAPPTVAGATGQATNYLQAAREIRNGVLRPEPSVNELHPGPVQLVSAEVQVEKDPGQEVQAKARMEVTSIRLPAGSSVKRGMAQGGSR